MTNNFSKTVMNAIRVECKKQHVGEDRVKMLFDAYAWMYQNNNSVLTLDSLCRLAGVIEPNNQGRFRGHPVTVYGGTVAPVESIEGIVQTAVMILNEAKLSYYKTSVVREDVDYAIKEFLYARPFSDGNGRVAWLLRVWALEEWGNPSELPKYFGEK